MNKLISAFLFVFQAVFLNVIVPGHTRGVITLSGKSSFAGMADFGCPFCSAPVRNDSKKSPNRQDRSECAICHLAVRLTAEPVIDFRLGELGLLEINPPPAPELTPICTVIHLHHCRGPPEVSL